MVYSPSTETIRKSFIPWAFVLLNSAHYIRNKQTNKQKKSYVVFKCVLLIYCFFFLFFWCINLYLWSSDALAHYGFWTLLATRQLLSKPHNQTEFLVTSVTFNFEEIRCGSDDDDRHRWISRSSFSRTALRNIISHFSAIRLKNWNRGKAKSFSPASLEGAKQSSGARWAKSGRQHAPSLPGGLRPCRKFCPKEVTRRGR